VLNIGLILLGWCKPKEAKHNLALQVLVLMAKHGRRQDNKEPIVLAHSSSEA